MNITVFTSCQPRHLALVERLASVADTAYACLEVNTLFPGQTEDFFRKSEVMKTYFGHVQEAERAEFGSVRFLPENVRTITMKMGDLNALDLSWLRPALQSEVIVVFGASYIRKPLIDVLLARGAINIHMGTSPYYRGSSCNFWALYDGRPDYVGATIHLLSAGLDSGAILCHALPQNREGESLDGFALGMRGVTAAFNTLVSLIKDERWREMKPVAQDKGLELRYTRNRDFTDRVATEYLDRVPAPKEISEALSSRDTNRFMLLEGPGLV